MFQNDISTKTIDFEKDPNNLPKYNTLFQESEYLEVELCIETFYIREICAEIKNEKGIIVRLIFNYVRDFYTPTGNYFDCKDNQRCEDKWTHCKLRLEEETTIRQMLRLITIANYSLYEENSGFFIKSRNLYIAI